MHDAEAVFLVDYHEAEVLELYVVGEQPVGPDDYVDLAVGEVRQYLPLARGLDEARDCLDAHACVREARGEGFIVLLREQRRRHHDGGLFAREGRLARRAYRDLGFAEADVADDEAVHRHGPLHVLLDLFDGAELVSSLLVREAFL